MTVHLIATISSERIRIETPGTELCQDFPNSAIYDRETKAPLAFGVTVEDFEKENPAEWQQTRHQVGFVTLFTPDAPKHDLETAFLEYYRAIAADNSHSFLSKIGLFFLERYDFTFWIQEYESWPAERRQQFEYDLQAYHRANRLAINGQERQLPPWKRSVEGWVRILLTAGLPLACVIGILMGLRTNQRPAVLLVSLLIIPVPAAVLGEAIWMLSMKKLLPASYLRYLSKKLPFRWIAERLSALFLPDENR